MQVSLVAVGGCSLLATMATLANAMLINQQFYPSIVYITKSNASMAVIYFQAVMIVFTMFQVLKRVFFGELRAAETEHLSERAWHAVLETCLAFTVFRDDFSPMFVMQFVLLLFIKCFHWLADDRVDVMERSPLITLKFHMRMLAVIGCLTAVDSYLVSHAYFSIMMKGASSQLVFGFEYAILMTLVLHVSVKYILHMHDLRTAQAWDAKAVYLLYAELVMNFARCLLYGLFALLMVRLHTFPLFSIRPFYLSVRALHKALNDVILSRRAIAAMNTMFPVVSTTELANMDATCIICREEMTAESQPKRLPCSHVFHAHCLRSWFQRQQTCPTCRTDILRPAQNPREAAAQGAPAAPAQGQLPFVPFVAHQFAFHAAQQVDPAANQRPAEANRNAAPAPGIPPHPMFVNAFPGVPFMNPMGLIPPIPPPMPAMPVPLRPSLEGLSDEELRSMEGNTREAVMNRIRILQDVSTLMDAIDVMMRQYHQVANIAASTPSAPNVNVSQPNVASDNGVNTSSTAPTVANVRDQTDATITNTSNTAADREEGDSDTDPPVIIENQDIEHAETSDVGTSGSDVPGGTTSLNTNDSAGSEDELHDLRQRRLARFSAGPNGESNG